MKPLACRSILMFLGSLTVWLASAEKANAELLVGAAVVDVTPDQLPVLINGGMLSRTADSVKTRVNARAIVLSDGHGANRNRRRGQLHVATCSD